MNFLQFTKQMLPYQVFSVMEALKRFPDMDTRRLVEWQKKGYITKLINKWYLFDETVKSEFLLYRISNCLRRPSYISMESALAYYNLIPEAVFTIQAITTKKTQLYATAAGAFNYRNMKPSLFFGYTVLHVDELPVLMAEKEKAILDYLYLNTHLNDEKEIAALRLNKAGMQGMDWSKLNEYATLFNSKVLDQRINTLKLHFSYDEAG